MFLTFWIHHYAHLLTLFLKEEEEEIENDLSSELSLPAVRNVTHTTQQLLRVLAQHMTQQSEFCNYGIIMLCSALLGFFFIHMKLIKSTRVPLTKVT